MFQRCYGPRATLATLSANVARPSRGRPYPDPVTDPDYPGQSLGLPAAGPGSLATWRSRVAALTVDWAASMVLAVAAFGVGVLNQPGWRSWMILAVFFVQRTILTTFAGGSFGQLLARIGVVRLEGGPVGFGRSLARAAMICLVLPAVVIGAERRGLDDLALGTVVVTRR